MRRFPSLLAACVLASSATLAHAETPVEDPSRPHAPPPAEDPSRPHAPPPAEDPSRPHAPPAEDPSRPHAPPPVDDFTRPSAGAPADEIPEAPRIQGDEPSGPGYFDAPFLSLTLHPLLLLNPVVEIGAEVKIDYKWSVATVIGAGSVRAKGPTTGDEIRLGLVSVGGQLRYYLVQGFTSGFFVAFDAEYSHVDTDQLVDLTLVGTAAGLGLGVLGGFKLVLPRGGTVDLGFGVRRLLLRPTPSVPSREGVGDQPAGYLLALRIGAGWTF